MKKIKLFLLLTLFQNILSMEIDEISKKRKFEDQENQLENKRQNIQDFNFKELNNNTEFSDLPVEILEYIILNKIKDIKLNSDNKYTTALSARKIIDKFCCLNKSTYDLRESLLFQSSKILFNLDKKFSKNIITFSNLSQSFKDNFFYSNLNSLIGLIECYGSRKLIFSEDNCNIDFSFELSLLKDIAEKYKFKNLKDNLKNSNLAITKANLDFLNNLDFNTLESNLKEGSTNYIYSEEFNLYLQELYKKTVVILFGKCFGSFLSGVKSDYSNLLLNLIFYNISFLQNIKILDSLKNIINYLMSLKDVNVNLATKCGYAPLVGLLKNFYFADQANLIKAFTSRSDFDVNCVDKDGYSILYFLSNKPHLNELTKEILIKNKDVININYLHKKGHILEFIDINLDLILFILENFKNNLDPSLFSKSLIKVINSLNTNCSKEKKIELLNIMLSKVILPNKDIDINYRTFFGENILSRALRNGHCNFVKEILIKFKEKIDINIEDHLAEDLLYISLSIPLPSICNTIFKHFDDELNFNILLKGEFKFPANMFTLKKYSKIRNFISKILTHKNTDINRIDKNGNNILEYFLSIKELKVFEELLDNPKINLDYIKKLSQDQIKFNSLPDMLKEKINHLVNKN